MSQVLSYGVEPDGETIISYVYTRRGIKGEQVADDALKRRGATTRGLQAASNPDDFNIDDFPSTAAQGEQIRYEIEEITMSEARIIPEVEGYITSDDEFDYDEDDVLFVKHKWHIPSVLIQIE